MCRDACLNGDATGWLLESDDPSVRYLTLVDVLGRDPDSGEVSQVRERLMSEGPVARLLAAQQPDGHWGRKEDFYVRSKYHGTIWNLHLLAEMGADPDNERVRRAGEFILRWSQRPDGGFTHNGTAAGGKGLAMSCLTGNMVWALSRLGFRSDPRVALAREKLVGLCFGEVGGFSRGRCDRCRSGPIKVLKAFAEVDRPTSREKEAIGLLRGQVVGECLPGQGRGPRPEWGQVWYPLFWNTDMVEILELMGRTGGLVPEAMPALDAILAKQDAGGRWALEKSYHGRCLVGFEPLKRPSRRATLRVLTMLRHVRPLAKLMVR